MVGHLLARLVHPEIAVGDEGVDVGLDVSVHCGLLYHRVVGDRLAAAGGCAHKSQQVLQRFVPVGRDSPPAVLNLQGGLGYLPALVLLADEMIAGDPDVVHENRALVVAGEQIEPLEFQSR